VQKRQPVGQFKGLRRVIERRARVVFVSQGLGQCLCQRIARARSRGEPARRKPRCGLLPRGQRNRDAGGQRHSPAQRGQQGRRHSHDCARSCRVFLQPALDGLGQLYVVQRTIALRDLGQQVPSLRGQERQAVAGDVLRLGQAQPGNPSPVELGIARGHLQGDVRTGQVVQRGAEARQVERGLVAHARPVRVAGLCLARQQKPVAAAQAVRDEQGVSQRGVGGFDLTGIQRRAHHTIIRLAGQGQYGDIGGNGFCRYDGHGIDPGSGLRGLARQEEISSQQAHAGQGQEDNGADQESQQPSRSAFGLHVSLSEKWFSLPPGEQMKT